MRNLSANMISYLANDITSLQLCWEIRRTDGVSLYYTEYDNDVIINGNTYKKRNAGIGQSLKFQDALKGNNSNIDMILNDDSITINDLYSFKYDNAEIYVSIIHPDNPDDQVKLVYGKLGNTKINQDKATIEFQSISILLDKNIGRKYTYDCDAELFDSYCSANQTGHIFNNQSPTGIDPTKPFTVFTDTNLNKENDWFTNAYIKWLTGNNKGIETKVKSYKNDIITLSLGMPFEIDVNDTYLIYSGCDKSFTTCKEKFSNVRNYKGFPYIPNADEMVKYE